MKKLVITTVIGTMLCGLTAFGQGWVNFNGGRHTANNFFTTPGVIDTSFANLDVALYIAIAPTNTYTGAPLAETLENGVSTNAAAISSINWSQAQAWTAITSDPNFQLATDVLAGNSVITNTAVGNNGGTWVYKTGANNNVEMNTVAGIIGGDVYEMYVIGWNSAYATPGAAATAGSAVGWSQEFTYLTGASSVSTVVATPVTPTFAVITVPEPTTMALGALGGIALLAFRRKKA